MNCPGCGAAMQLVGSRGYFHCQHCGNFHFPEATPEGVGILGDPAGVDCPVCNVALLTALVESEAVSYCERCRGFLTTTSSFGLIVNKRRARRSPHEEKREPFDPIELKRGVQCPRCRRRMDTHPYSGGGNAVIDSCERCGVVWLDAGELAIIERYIPTQHRIEPALRLAPEEPSKPTLFGIGADPDAADWWPF